MVLLSTNKDIFFEFQPELENYILFVFGTFFDFFFTLILILVFLFKFILIKNPMVMLNNIFFILFWIYYWFSGAGIFQDFFLIIILFGVIEIIRWGLFFLFYLCKIKNYY